MSNTAVKIELPTLPSSGEVIRAIESKGKLKSFSRASLTLVERPSSATVYRDENDIMMIGLRHIFLSTAVKTLYVFTFFTLLSLLSLVLA